MPSFPPCGLVGAIRRYGRRASRCHAAGCARPPRGNFAAASRVRVDQFLVRGPDLLDREVRAEHRALRAEDRDGLARDRLDVRRIVAMDEGAERRGLGNDIRLRGERCHAGAPFGPALLGQVLQHAGVLQDERHLRARGGKLRGARHLRREHLQVEAPAVVGKRRDVALDLWVGRKVRPRREAIGLVLVPVQLHAHAAHQRILRQPIELRAHVVDGDVRIADDAVRPAVRRPRPRSPTRPRPRTSPSASSPARRPTSRRRCRTRSSRNSSIR